MTRYEARIKQAPWILCGVREGSAREADGGRGRDRKNEKKEGGDYRRLLSRIRLVIIVISTVRNARVSASVCVKREKRGEERKLKRGQRKEDGERERSAARQRRDWQHSVLKEKREKNNTRWNLNKIVLYIYALRYLDRRASCFPRKNIDTNVPDLKALRSLWLPKCFTVGKNFATKVRKSSRRRFRGKILKATE